MSENSRALEAVKFPRYERRGLFMGLKWYQLLLLAAAVLVASTASAIRGPVGLFASGPIWLSLILLGLLQYSRIPYPVWAGHAALFFYRLAAKQTRFLVRPERPALAGRLALPGGLGNLELRRTSTGESFVVDARGREAIAVLRCSTRSFALLDSDDKAWAVQAWSRVQAGMAQRSSVARIAVQDYTIPYPSSALRHFYERTAPDRASTPKELTWGQRAYEDLIAAAGSAMSHDLLLALVVDTGKARRRIKESGGGLAGVEQVLRLEVEAMTTALDVKKLGKIPTGGGWRVHGRSEAVKGRGVGYDYVHVAVDDHSRLAYVEVLPDEKGSTCARFLDAAAAFMAANGAPVQEVMTDNALAYIRSAAFAKVMADLGAKHRRTKPRSPWQHGKAGFNRTLQEGWAYKNAYDSSDHRTQALTGWLDFYNHRRNHSALGGRPPISRCNQPAG